ncbi:gliding motility-associated C-terminal domain-containing protein [Taibaiella lutea]|uniref:Gliding motility-associated C-terminal domain-containing protein n=1 Tax=Taibaiella lutea TaxID=2608001 RepID=A0A5M6CQA7_9BACT|nr:gliding motility-associated C-terminal domain-containing protein [Taibaiella lutea]KAA5537153.1 gliding motility-associated C-terminal domain-containing protein [Taibaiella lutea]
MKYLLQGILLLSFLVITNTLNAQLLPAFRAEQDACNALQICGNQFHTPYSYQGEGFELDLPGTQCGAGESNSVWLKLNIVTSGVIVFTVTPNVSSDDYDWAVVDITGKPCDNFNETDVVRCNFNNNSPIFNGGVTGLNTSSNELSATSGITGHSFLRKLDVTAGQVYLVMVNNFGSGATGGDLGSGFTIDFSGSTAIYNNNAAPKFASASNICIQGSQVTVALNKDVLCSSIATNGSDFTLIGPTTATVTSAAGLNCNSLNQGYSDEMTVTFNQSLSSGTYYLKIKNGTDNNTLFDLCNLPMNVGDSIKFTVYPDQRVTIPVDTEGCGSVVFNGNTYTQSIVLHDTVRNAGGCDSIYYIANITVYPLNPLTVNETVGHCDSVTFRGTTYTSEATVIDTFKNHLGCDSLLHVYHIVPEHLTISVTADPPEPVIGDYVTLTVSGNVDGYGVQSWSPSELFPNQSSFSQSYIIPHSDTIIVVGTSPNGCIDTAKIFVKADTLVPVVIMPNAFSPNGDGLNDVFEPYFVNKSGYIVKDFKVFDRWGKLIYQAAATKRARWNGSYFNEDKSAPTGTYYFYIDVQFVDGTKKYFKGDVTLLR